MRSREANKKTIVIIQERDGDAWGQVILLEVKRGVWMLDLFWRRSLHDWIWGMMEREGSRKMVVLQMGNPGAGALEEDQNRLGLLNEKCLLNIKGRRGRAVGYVSLGWRKSAGPERYPWELSAYL